MAEPVQDVLRSMSELLSRGDVAFDDRDPKLALECYRNAMRADPFSQQIREAQQALSTDDPVRARAIFAGVLRKAERHIAATHGLAMVCLRSGQLEPAEQLLLAAQQESRYHPMILQGLARLFMSRERFDDAANALEQMLLLNPQATNTKREFVQVLLMLGNYERARRVVDELLVESPMYADGWFFKGVVARVLGEREACAAAFKKAIELSPDMGEAWSGLANLKTYSFSDHEVSEMQHALSTARHPTAQRVPLHFALGKAFEDRGDVDAAFRHFQLGNSLWRDHHPHDRAAHAARIERIKSVYPLGRLNPPTQPGPGPRPIFIIGLPRTGSTLVEQILASHSQIEGTRELSLMPRYAIETRDGSAEVDFASFGRRYLQESAPFRTAAPFFTDKRPDNFLHVGLLSLMLPDAVLIDVRRDAMDTCLSCFKHHFPAYYTFASDLADLAEYYRGYIDLMAHWGRVLPGRVLEVEYEQLVQEPEHQIRRMLDHVGVPFEDACLRPHLTSRPIYTPSSEQVREPMHRQNIGAWKRYEAHLNGLKLALGGIAEP